MPVLGVTDKPRRFPRAGKVRLGDQSGTRGAPVNRDYFVVPEEVQAVYGEKPSQLKVIFLSDDEEVMASTWYRAYNESYGLICKGDGATADAVLDADEVKKLKLAPNVPVPPEKLNLDIWAHGATSGRNQDQATKNVERQRIGCPGRGYDGKPPCPMYAAKKCAIRGFFQYMIVDVPGVAVYQMDTGSVINIDNILGTLTAARMLYGSAAGIPILLERIQVEGHDARGRKTKNWVVKASVDPEYSHRDLLQLVASGRVVTAILPPVDETEVYDKVIEDDVDDGKVAETAPPSSNVQVICAPGKHDPQYANGGELVCRECGELLDEQQYNPDPQPQEGAQQAPVSASNGTPVAPGPTTAAASPPAPPAKPADLRAKIPPLMNEVMQTYGGSSSGQWLTVYGELKQFMPNSTDRFDLTKVPEDRLQACVDFLKQKRGDPE